MPVTAAPSLPPYSLFFDVAGNDEGRRAWPNDQRTDEDKPPADSDCANECPDKYA
jgi:hypothetical protein